MLNFKKYLFFVLSLITLLALAAGCATPTPEVIEKEVIVTKIVEETVYVEGTPEVVEVEVTTIVQETVEKEVLVTPTSLPTRDVIIVALSEAPTTLDPADHRSRQSETVIRNMFDGLVTRDTRSGVHLELAEALEWLDDVTLQVKLREGVLFHDGVEMTADDVVYTFERIINENMIEYPEAHTSPRKGLIAQLATIEKVDDYTVVMHFSNVWPVAMQMLVHQQIVPKHYLEEVGTEGFVAHPIGTGPFKFVSAEGLDEIVLERFDDYFGGAPDLEPVGPACVKQVVFSVIPETSTRVAALLAGEVDIIQVLPAELIDTLDQTPGVQVGTAPSTQPKWMEMNVSQPPFDDVLVRQAMNYAVDKDLIIEAIYGGRAVALPGPLSPYNNYVNKSLVPYPYDPDMALDLFAQAGWTDSDGDGMLDKNGQTLAFTLDTIEQFRPLAEAVAGQFRAIGVDASVRFWEYSVVKPMLMAGERMAYLDDWGDSAFDPVGHFEAKWHGYVEGESYGRGNFSTYNNERVNELIKLGETTGDVDERQALYDEAQAIVYEEAPAVFLILPEEAEAARADILNWEPASDGRINLHDVCIAQ
ncbi:MAG: ABC transporter substrate-binding protein [Anaerolineales bacterium]|nr:ABC transporter substrate-binding protein [Anaerolineales bacterium]